MIWFLIFAAALNETVQLPAAAAQQSMPSDPALSIATAMNARGQLRGMILATLSRTTTGGVIIEKLGNDAATAVLVRETDKAVDRYGDEWTALLADAYRETLTPAELAIAQGAIAARDSATLAPLLNRVGPVMQSKATPLLEKAAGEALAAAFKSVGKEAPK